MASSLTSAQSWVPNDSATISAPAGSGNLAGTVSFDLYAYGDCTRRRAIYSTTASRLRGLPADGVDVEHDVQAQTASGIFSWQVSYDSTNPAQRDIPASCHETSALTIANGGTISSP